MKGRLASLRVCTKEYASPTVRIVSTYLVTSVITTVVTPYRHSLLTSSTSWLLVWSYCVFIFGLRRKGLQDGKRKAARAAGLLFAVSAVCERVTGDQLAVLALKALLPSFTAALSYLVSEALRDAPAPPTFPESKAGTPPLWTCRLRYLLALSFVAASTFMRGAYISQQTVALSLAATLVQAGALVMLGKAGGRSVHDPDGTQRVAGSHRWADDVVQGHEARESTSLEVMRTVSLTAALGCLLGCTFVEQLPSFDSSGYAKTLVSSGSASSFIFTVAPLAKGISAPFFGAISTSLFIILTLQSGYLRASVVSLSTAVANQLLKSPSLFAAAQAASYMLVSILHWRTFGTIFSGRTGNTSAAPGTSAVLSSSLLLLAALWLLFSGLPSLSGPISVSSSWWRSNSTSALPSLSDGQPLQLGNSHHHPIETLCSEAQVRFNMTVARQSETLSDMVTEYRRRYGMHPPPNLDKWFEYAKQKGTVLIDEFDSIYHDLLPFWALSPFALRQRVQEAFGYDVNGLMTLMIRNGQITLMDGSRGWLREALREMTADFIQYLPDMDIAFNIHDEPRVTVPHSELSQMVQHAKSVALPAVQANDSPRNAFSPRASDMTDGKDYKRTTITRFNKFSHQPTWSHARLSCPPDSPARDYLEQAPDNLTAWAVGDVGFIHNYTSFSDICNSPSLSSTYGFFDRPNVFIPSQDLVPVFSQSKLSSFQDIVYPSPWYWADKVKYDSKDDMPWEEKETKLYWRGTTTGGYSRYGGWRRHHRQRAVQHVNALDDTRILRNHNLDGDGAADWRTESARKSDYAESFDVHFSDVGQCDAGDCHAQREFFNIAKKDDQKAAWGHKFLLDMDGNAFSGRFAAFLKSSSLVCKMALFKEWHTDWLQPWLHFVPLSLRGDEWFAVIRYLAGEDDGKVMAKRMAEESQTWANQVLRKEDMQVWLFRLLLEYGRLMDDERDIIGYAGP